MTLRLSDFSALVIVTALMPFFRLTPLPSDVQPYFLVLFALWVLPMTIMDAARQYQASIALALGAGLLIWCFAAEGYSDAVPMFSLPIFVYWLATQPPRASTQAIKIAICLYLFGCALQLILGKDVLDPIVSNLRVSEGRGLTSFTSEPSYLGLVGIVLATGAMYYRMGVTWIILACFLVLLCMSGTAIAPLVLILAIYAVSTGNLRLLAVGAVVAIVAGSLLFTANDRFVMLAQNVRYDPMYIFQDQSGANRLIHILAPIQAAWRDGFVPHRFPYDGQITADFFFATSGTDYSLERLSNIASILAYVLGGFGVALFVWAFVYAKTRAYVYAAALCLLFINISDAAPYPMLVFALMFRGRLRGIGHRKPALNSARHDDNFVASPKLVLNPPNRRR